VNISFLDDFNIQTVFVYAPPPQRGFLSSKLYDDGKSVSYTYNYDGSLATRVWARGITTTYGYDNAGALSGVTYSNSTPSVSYTRDRMGRPVSITDAAGSHTLTYNVDGSLASEGTVGYTYDALGRRSSMSVTGGASTNYTYDGMSRLATVSDGTRTATYSRVSGSNLLANTTINNGTSDILTASRTYDILDRLTNITSNGISYNYTYDNSDKRTKNTLSDGSYWIYEYDNLGQITKGQKFTANGVAIWGQSFGYNYDNIGNLKSENRNGNIFKYTANNVNQYTQRTVPGRVNISGSADASAKVTIKQGSGTYTRPQRYGNYFNSFFTLDNSTTSVSDTFDVYAVKFDGTKDIVAKQSLDIFVPKTPELFTYDNDGNLLSDGRFTYTWNGENRLVSAVETGKQKIDFIYDYQGRRINKKVYSWNGSAWVLDSEIKFVYDRYNIVAEYDASNNLLNSYLWGEDVSGSLDGAGGVGGLLAVNNYLPCYDGNGNVMSYINAMDGTVCAEYQYNPFGGIISKSGTFANSFKMLFSTKYYDKETETFYYLYRDYKPEIARWLSRDPIEEQGGKNLYAFVNNSSPNGIDALGLDFIAVADRTLEIMNWVGIWYHYSIQYWESECPFDPLGHSDGFSEEEIKKKCREKAKKLASVELMPVDGYKAWRATSIQAGGGFRINAWEVWNVSISFIMFQDDGEDIMPIFDGNKSRVNKMWKRIESIAKNYKWAEEYGSATFEKWPQSIYETLGNNSNTFVHDTIMKVGLPWTEMDGFHPGNSHPQLSDEHSRFRYSIKPWRSGYQSTPEPSKNLLPITPYY